MKTAREILLASKPYRELLATDEWKMFARDFRRQRDNSCAHCKRTGVETNVHHLFYEPDKLPWEYATTELVLLCRECHEGIHEELKKFRKYVFSYLNRQSFRVLNGALRVGLEQNNPLDFCYAVAEMAASPRSVTNFKNAWVNTKPKLTAPPSAPCPAN